MPKKRIDPLTKLREIIARWPETREQLSHGAPTFWGGKRTFATFHPATHDKYGPMSIWCLQPLELQRDLVDAMPDRLFIPPYVGHKGWVAIRVDDDRVDWALVEDMLERGYRMVAPKRALKLLDEAG